MAHNLTRDAWKQHGLSRVARIVLVRLCDYARNGSNTAWPSVDTLAADCGYSARRVQQALAGLRKDGYIRPVEHACGGRSRTVTYEILIDESGCISPLKGEIVSPFADAKGCNPEHERVKSTTQKGEIYDTHTYIEPELEPDMNRESAREEETRPSPNASRGGGDAAAVVDGGVDDQPPPLGRSRLRYSGAQQHCTPLPDMDGLPFEWEVMANKRGMRRDDAKLQFDKFRAHYSATGDRFLRWDSVWLKWIITDEEFSKNRKGGNNGSGTGNYAAANAAAIDDAWSVAASAVRVERSGSGSVGAPAQGYARDQGRGAPDALVIEADAQAC